MICPVEESESFDSLTSKFARTADILTQKVLRTIFILLRERIDTFIDKANSAEKFNIINSAENLIIIRDLRNTIAHEYIPEQLKMLYNEVFEMAEKLLKEIKLTEKFCHKKFNIQILAEN